LIEIGQEVHLKVRSHPQLTFVGAVVHVAKGATMTPDGSRFPVTVLLDNSDHILRRGMTGYAKIRVGEASLAKLLLHKITSTVRVEFWSWW